MTFDKPSSKNALVIKSIERFWETFPSVWGRIRGNVRHIAMTQFNLTVAQFNILRLIRKGCHSASELADELQISRSAVSQAVDLMVEKNLVTRCDQTDDRRFVHLELTDSGNELLNTLFEKNRAWMIKKMADLSPDDLNNIMRTMDVLKKTFDPPVK